MRRADIRKLLNIGCEVMAIEAPQLIYWDRDGKYFPDGRLYLNDKKDDRMIVFTLFHELRHAYQIEACREHWEDPVTVKKWDYELTHYIPGGTPGHGEQAIEIDAHAFACAMIIVIFRFQPIVPDVDPQKLRHRTEELLEEYGEEIMEISQQYRLPEVK